MSTHSAECSPHTCFTAETMRRAPSTDAAYGRTLIRKTSLLRKINPMMRRSSFTNKEHPKPDHLAMNEHQTFQEIVIGIKRITSRDPNSDQSPLYDVRNHARVSRRIRHEKRCFADDYLRQWSARLRSFELRRARFDRHARPCHASPKAKRGGARRDRTDDLMLAKHALSQLSYGPVPEDECFLLRSPSLALRRSSLRSRRPAEPKLHQAAKAGGPGKT